MKHLKRFNESTNSQYSQITQEYWSDMWYGNKSFLHVDDDILNTIKDSVNSDRYEVDIDQEMFSGIEDEDGDMVSGIDIQCIDNRMSGVGIVMDMDEWFYVCISDENNNTDLYKCDQIEGLMSLLGDKNILK